MNAQLKVMHTPPEGCICSHVLAARAQACADQLVGLKTLLEPHAISKLSQHLLTHYGQLATLLQEAVNTFSEYDGCPDPAMDADAAAWVLKGLRG